MKRDELAARIWRTIVFSGAMLASPVAGAEKAEPPAKPAKPVAAPTVESLTEQIAILDKRITLETEAVAAAKDAAARRAAQQRLAGLQRDRAVLEARRAELVVAALEKQLAELTPRIDAAIAAVSNAKTDAERKAAKARLDAVKAEQATLQQKLAAARPAPVPRPRNGDADRPTGRGFVLS